MDIRGIIAPGIIFAAGSMAGTASAATTIDTNIAPTVEGTPVVLAGGVDGLGAPQFLFEDRSDQETKYQISASSFDPAAGIFYQGSSVTLASPTDSRFALSIRTRDDSGAKGAAGDGNYALRFSASGTTYTGFATLTGNGSLIDSATFQPSAVPAVPEPSTWAMMILGMGLVGSEIRRRRRQGRKMALAA